MVENIFKRIQSNEGEFSDSCIFDLYFNKNHFLKELNKKKTQSKILIFPRLGNQFDFLQNFGALGFGGQYASLDNLRSF